MALITQRDFETKTGQEKIVRTIHKLEASLHELHKKLDQLARNEKSLEHDLEGPEAY